MSVRDLSRLILNTLKQLTTYLSHGLFKSRLILPRINDLNYSLAMELNKKSQGIHSSITATLFLFKKCKASGQSEYRVLLDWRNMPSEGMDTFPAQRLMGRRCVQNTSTNNSFPLQPRYDTDEDALALLGQQEKQSYHYDKNARTP